MTGLSSFEQIDISFSNGKDQLAGIIVLPVLDNLRQAIVLVHGSGPADRDSCGSFIVLREYFTKHGYAVLCYDKPGIGESTGD